MLGFFVLKQFQMHQVYILFSEKLNRYYIGYTSDLRTRMEFHNNSENRKFTHNASDWKIFFEINCENKTQALAIEKQIKAMKSKVFIENLIKYPEMVVKLKIKYSID